MVRTSEDVLLLRSLRHNVLFVFFRSRSPYVQVTGQTSSVQSSCPTPTVRRSSPAPETASSTTPTLRRVRTTTDSVSSPAIMEQLTRYWTRELFHRAYTSFSCGFCVLNTASCLFVCFLPDYDGTKRPLHVFVVWGGRHGAMVWPSHEDELH